MLFFEVCTYLGKAYEIPTLGIKNSHTHQKPLQNQPNIEVPIHMTPDLLSHSLEGVIFSAIDKTLDLYIGSIHTRQTRSMMI